MQSVFVQWSEFKVKVPNGKRLRYIDRDSFYLLYFKDDIGSEFETSILKDDGADQIEFETSYKMSANQSLISPIDSDGAIIQRSKVTQTGWSYQLHGIEFETSSLSSLYSKDFSGNDYGFSTLKFYDASNIELTTQESIDAGCVKTIMDWEPTYDYEVIGGIIKQKENPSTDIRMWVIGVPDIGAAYGGSKCFGSNINMAFIGLKDGVRMDGRVTKKLSYNATYHTNKLRLILKHDIGIKHKLHLIFELFKL